MNPKNLKCRTEFKTLAKHQKTAALKFNERNYDKFM